MNLPPPDDGIFRNLGNQRHSYRVRQTPEEGRRAYSPKLREYKKKDDDNSPKILNDKNHQALSQKLRQLVFITFGIIPRPHFCNVP